MSMNHSITSKDKSIVLDNITKEYKLPLDLVQNSIQIKFKRINSTQYLIKSFKNIKNNKILNQEKSNNIDINNNSTRNKFINDQTLTMNINRTNINENNENNPNKNSSKTSSNIIINTSSSIFQTSSNYVYYCNKKSKNYFENGLIEKE